jgi:hypothetical protein
MSDKQEIDHDVLDVEKYYALTDAQKDAFLQEHPCPTCHEVCPRDLDGTWGIYEDADGSGTQAGHIACLKMYARRMEREWKTMSKWAAAEKARGRPESELTWGNCVEELGLVKRPVFSAEDIEQATKLKLPVEVQ